MQKRKNRKIPSYLSWSGYSYLFRIAIPAKLQAIIGKKELKYSLKSGSLSRAKRRSVIIAGKGISFSRSHRRIASGTSPSKTSLIREKTTKPKAADCPK